MTVQVHRSSVTGEALIRFIIDDHVHEGVVSVVGSFNDWTPGVTVFILQPNGTRVAEVTVPADEDVHFRYLGSEGSWFDEPDVGVTDAGSVIHFGASQRQ